MAISEGSWRILMLFVLFMLLTYAMISRMSYSLSGLESYRLSVLLSLAFLIGWASQVVGSLFNIL